MDINNFARSFPLRVATVIVAGAVCLVAIIGMMASRFDQVELAEAATDYNQCKAFGDPCTGNDTVCRVGGKDQTVVCNGKTWGAGGNHTGCNCPAAPTGPGFTDCTASVTKGAWCNAGGDFSSRCGWGGTSSASTHCYCAPDTTKGINTTDGKWVVDTDIAAYCRVCPLDGKACVCKYSVPQVPTAGSATAAVTSTTKNITANSPECGTGWDENYAISCQNPGQKAATKACLNQQCSGGNCIDGPMTPICKKMNSDVVQLINYYKQGLVGLNGLPTVTQAHSQYLTIKTTSDAVLNFGGLAVTAILQHSDKFAVTEDSIACANTVRTDCQDFSGGESYKCEPAGSCLVWNWMMGNQINCNGLGCEPNASGVGNAGYCKSPGGASGQATTGCIGSGVNQGKTTAIGLYSCGGVQGFTNVSYQCLSTGWDNGDNCAAKNDTCDPNTGKCKNTGYQQCSATCYDDPQCVQKCGSNDWYCDKSAGATSNPGAVGYSAYSMGYCVKKSGASGQGQSIGGCTKSGYTCTDKNGGTFTDTCISPSGSGSSSGTTKTSGTSGSSGTSGLSGSYTLKYECDKSGAGTCNQTKEMCSYGCSISAQGHACANSPSDCIGGTDAEKAEEAAKEAAEEAAKEAAEEAAKEAAEKAAKEAEAVKAVPTVKIESPSGTVTTKTADLKVTTNIKATCKYLDSKTGSFTSSNFDGNGMTMSDGDGYSHTATLSNLTEGDAANCKYSHSITVLCKNSATMSTTSRTSSTNTTNVTPGIGSAQTTFTVDLSQNAEYAPKVTSAMDSDSYTVANPVLKVNSDRPADCEYKEGASFTFGSGKKFDTTGDYNHNAQLNDLKTKQDGYDYYVICKDKATCATSDKSFKVEFKVVLSDDPINAPKIVGTTPENQTVANPTLSVTTDRPATCQYKKDTTFKYGDAAAIQFTNDGEYSHTVSLTTLTDGKYTFYVACKDKATGASITLETAIVTTINRTGGAGEPVISNTTPNSQNFGSTGISVTTTKAATCQYKEGVSFTYGGGTQFVTDGDVGHISELPGLTEGQHTFYVVCKDKTSGVANSTPTQIIFNVVGAVSTCASLSSNDKQNDNDRDNNEGDDSDSKYLWRSVEEGTRDKFTKVDWYAGYQFTPGENGRVTQLCGYFGDGNSNKVTLYNSSYKEIVSANVEGNDGWKCVSISPTPVKTDKRYYVIARVKDGPINFEYKAGLLPKDAENATVEAGIRQLGTSDFGNNIRKYDYMVFGLVDVRIQFESTNTNGPEVTASSPSGTITTNQTNIAVQTNIDATCKFDREDKEYSDMKYTFSQTSQKMHAQKVCQLDDGPFTFYVRCKGATGTNNASTLIQFEISD